MTPGAAFMMFTFPVAYVAGIVMLTYWVLGLRSEKRARPDASLFQLRGANPAGGGSALAGLDRTTRRRYSVAGMLWLLIAIIQVVDIAIISRTLNWPTLPIAAIFWIASACWIVWSLLAARSLLRNAS